MAVLTNISYIFFTSELARTSSILMEYLCTPEMIDTKLMNANGLNMLINTNISNVNLHNDWLPIDLSKTVAKVMYKALGDYIPF